MARTLENAVNMCPHCDASSFALRFPLWETSEFRVVCDAHPLVMGHVLILPKQHLPCIGGLEESQLPRFLDVYGLVRSFLCKTYGSCAAFEHGVSGQTVFHAHVHLLPFAGCLEDVLRTQTGVRQIDSLISLQKAYRAEGGYLFLALANRMYLLQQTLARPGLFREWFARALGSSDRWNWQRAHDDVRLTADFENDIASLQQAWRGHASAATKERDMTERRNAYLLRFTDMPRATANMAAADLRDRLRGISPHIHLEMVKDDPQTQDFGSTLVLVLGTPAAVALAASIGKGIAAYLARRTDARLSIETEDGKVAGEGLTSNDAARITELFLGRNRS